MTTSNPQKLLPRSIVLLAIGASISLWPAIPERGAISRQLGLIVPVAAQAPVTLDKTIRDYKQPSEVGWTGAPQQSITLHGSASQPGGIYVSLLRRPFDNWAAPHTHGTERYVTVLMGTFLAGTGPVQDKERVTALKAGTVVSETIGRMHYDGVGQDGVTLLFIGMGGPTPRGGPAEEPRAPGGPNVDPTARLAKLPENMVWSKAADGSTFTNVFGDPAKPGIYVQQVRRPANSWSTAHKHANDQFEWVMGGTMYIGTGSTVDKDKTVAMPTGSYIHDFANGVHYEGTKGEDLWLLVVGMGPAMPERAAN